MVKLNQSNADTPGPIDGFAEEVPPRVSLKPQDRCILTIDGKELATFDNSEKALHFTFPATITTPHEFRAVMYGMLVLGCHWGIISPIDGDPLYKDLEDRLGMNPYTWG